MAALAGAAAMKFAIVGTGAMGLEHIRNIALLKDLGASVVAVADTDANGRKEARETLDAAGFADAKVYETWDELLADPAADALIVATPNFTHIDVLRAVLPLKKHHVLCEKPLCTTVPDCLEVERMLAERGQTNLCFMVGMEYRWMPPMARLLEVVDSGVLGTLHTLSIREHRFPFLQKVGNWNRFNKFTGGTLVEKACHFFDLMRRMLANDAPVSVYAAGGSGINHCGERYEELGGAPDILDYALCVVKFANGASASLDLCMFAADEQTELVTATGHAGKVEALCPECIVRVSPRKSFAPGRTPPLGSERAVVQTEHIECDASLKAAGYHEGATYFCLRAFATAANAHQAPPVSARDGTFAVAMGKAAHLSLDENRVVRLDEILPAHYF